VEPFRQLSDTRSGKVGITDIVRQFGNGCRTQSPIQMIVQQNLGYLADLLFAGYSHGQNAIRSKAG
jgi:hypothetical protein